MPLAFARFPVNALTNPSGLLGTDGQIYVITSGESSALHTLTPELTTSLEAKGGGRGARGIRWAAIIWLLGRVVTYSPEFARLIIESSIIGSTKLGEITDLLLTRARESNMLSSPLRTGQLRVFLRKLANMQASPIFRLDAADAIDVATIYPPVAPAPATQPAQGPPSGGPRPPTGPPPLAAVTAMSIMAYGDIAPEALGAFELTVGPRLSGVDRSAQGGYQVVVTMVLQSALQAIVPLGVRGTFDLPTWIDARAQVEEFRRAFEPRRPAARAARSSARRTPWFMLAHPHYGWPEQLVCIPPWEGGEVCVVSVSVCPSECDLYARRWKCEPKARDAVSVNSETK